MRSDAASNSEPCTSITPEADPLHKVRRRPLLTGDEHLTDRRRERLVKHLPIGAPHGEVDVTWGVHQQDRSIYHAESRPAGLKLAEKLLDTLHACPTPRSSDSAGPYEPVTGSRQVPWSA
ncbi:hypothetical protein [Streptomyces spinosirectus]